MSNLHRPGKKSTGSRLVEVTTGKPTKKIVRTANGAITNQSSYNKVLDMFFLCGASRNMSEADIKKVFIEAIAENEELAIKCLFYARDIRGGQGERRFFRICLSYLREFYKHIYKKIVKYVPEYGRWDDLFFTTEHLLANRYLIKQGLKEKNGLLAKWLPRKGKHARLLREYLNLSPDKYRNKIVSLSNTVEQKMCSKTWSTIQYPTVPSVAMNKYRNAFLRNDTNRFKAYIESVTKGKKKINASAIYPHTLVQAMYKGGDKKGIEAQWNALPDYMAGSNDRILPVCDTSYSMNGLPMDVAIALGVYISERNQGLFNNAFMTFSAQPEMHYIDGSLYDRLNSIKNANAGYNTNLVATFNLLLSKAVQNNIKQYEMPNKILIISDMEFDGTGSGVFHEAGIKQKQSWNEFETNYDSIVNKYKKAGYEMPTLIFWNVNGRVDNVPATKFDRVGLVSGFSPSILKSILGGSIYNPVQLMLKTLNSNRYIGISF